MSHRPAGTPKRANGADPGTRLGPGSRVEKGLDWRRTGPGWSGPGGGGGWEFRGLVGPGVGRSRAERSRNESRRTDFAPSWLILITLRL